MPCLKKSQRHDDAFRLLSGVSVESSRSLILLCGGFGMHILMTVSGLRGATVAYRENEGVSFLLSLAVAGVTRRCREIGAAGGGFILSVADVAHTP